MLDALAAFPTFAHLPSLSHSTRRKCPPIFPRMFQDHDLIRVPSRRRNFFQCRLQDRHLPIEINLHQLQCLVRIACPKIIKRRVILLHLRRRRIRPQTGKVVPIPMRRRQSTANNADNQSTDEKKVCACFAHGRRVGQWPPRINFHSTCNRSLPAAHNPPQTRPRPQFHSNKFLSIARVHRQNS